jgi:hypothetical protein
MTLKSLRLVLTIVPVLVAVGIVAACGPYSQSVYLPPAAPPQQPQVYYYPAPMPPPAQVPMPAGWNLTVVDGKLQMQTADGARSVCEHLTFLVTGVDPVEAVVSGKRIQIACGKDAPGSILLQASGDRLSRSGAEGSIVTLEGGAKLVYVRNNKKAEISADRASVNLMTGQIVSDMDVPQQVTPVMPCVDSVPCPAAPTPLSSTTSSFGAAVGTACTPR